ncbi:zinc finger, CCHC-type containing protein [Tanacetum coccineum]
MAAAAMKHMASNFAKLDKFEGVDFRRWHKKMHFLLSSMSMVYVLTTLMPEDGGDNPTVEQNVESSKKLWGSLEAKYIAEDASILEQYNELLGILGRSTQHKINMDEAIQVSCIIDKLPPFWKDFRHTLKHKKKELTLVELGSHLRIEESLRVQDSDKPNSNNVVGPSVFNMVEHNNSSSKANGSGTKSSADGSSNSLKAFMSTSKLNNSILWHARLGHVHFKRMQDMSKDGLILAFDMDTKKCKTCMLTKITKKPFQNVKRETEVLELIHSDLCDLHATPSLGNKKYFVTFIDDASRFCYVYLLHTKDEALDKFKVFKTEVELQQGLLVLSMETTTASKLHNKSSISKRKIGQLNYSTNLKPKNLGKEALNASFVGLSKSMVPMLLVPKPSLRIPNKTKNIGGSVVPKEVTKEIDDCESEGLVIIGLREASRPSSYAPLSFDHHPSLIANHWMPLLSPWIKIEAHRLPTWQSIVCRSLMAAVRLSNPKLKTLGKRGFECVFVGYAEHSNAFRFYVIKPNESVVINSIIESRDAIFDENRFSSVPKPSLRIPNGTEDIDGLVVLEEVTKEVVQQPEPELRKSKKNRTPKNFRPEFQLYLIEGTRDEVSDQHSYCFNVEDDPKAFDEAMKSHDVAFWKEAINDEMDSIIGNNTWVLADLPSCCKHLGWIDYFDTYAPEARMSTIRLLIAMASIQNLIIHQMDVKTAFLNGELDEEVYINQSQGFIMPGNENKVCNRIKSLYGLKQAPKQWHQKFDEVVLSNGYLLNQAEKYVYCKFDKSGKGVIICLYVYNMLILSTDQVQFDLTKEFLSSRFSMKDMGEAIFNYFDSTSAPMDTSEKLMPNNGQAVSQLEYSMVGGYLMYVMTYTRSDIAFVVGKLSRLTYTGYPSVLEGYTDASWISNTKANSSTSGWVFLLGGGAISWASKKQTCITGSIMKSEFVALATACKESEWHNMVRELIRNGVVSVEFVLSQQNLADHLTKGLARDLVIKSAEGMRLKSNYVAEC